MKKLTNWLRWFDDNILKILLIGYIFIIPLYPKFPLRLIEYTYIAIRVDDLITCLIAAVFFLQLIRGKVQIDKKFAVLFCAFWAAVFASFAVGYFLQGSIRQQLMQVSLLHSMRRVQYMLFFFVAYTTVKKKEDLFLYLRLISIVLCVVVLYGIGQKFFGLPAVQTMNPAFAKGQLLYLTPEARISSTFGGHYDLAAYLVLLIPLIFSLYFYTKNKLYYITGVLAIFALTLTASRISFGAYVISIIPFLLYIKKYKHLVFIIVLTAAMTFLSQNLTSRFLQTFQIKTILVNEKTGRSVLPQNISTKELPAGNAYVEIPGQDQDSIIVNKETAELVKDHVRDQVIREASAAGRQLTTAEIDELTSTLSAGLKPVQTVSTDISSATRLQVEWPRAIKAFLRNPLFGTGPASITEATDNDYLRWLGEFGLVGTGIFLYIIYSIVYPFFLESRKKNSMAMVYSGVLFGIFALLINASYIDVFEASKVAYHFWLLAGIFTATRELKHSA